MDFNVVTWIVARDGGEIVVACYFAYLFYGTTALRRASFALPALPLAVVAHHLISEIDQHWRPVELIVALLVPAVIMGYCFTHLPTAKADVKRRESQKRWGANFVAIVITLEVFEATVSTLEQSGIEIRKGIVSGALLLTGAIVLAQVVAAVVARRQRREKKPDFREMISAHMSTAMGWLNLLVAVFGLIILYNVHEPLEEYHKESLVLPIMLAYAVLLVVLAVSTVSLLRAKKRSASELR